MKLPSHKTKIVCTIGPASASLKILKEMIRAGMNVARLNFSHGEFDSHQKDIDNIREAARSLGQRVAIMADMPGPKIRIGQLAEEPVELNPGDLFTLTTQEIIGDAARVSVTFAGLPQAVSPGNILFLNDGLIQMEVIRIEGTDVTCHVLVGGELRSRKGLNLPGINLGISAFTKHDRQCLKFALDHGVDAISQSFVESGADITAVREAAAALGYTPLIIAKIERTRALEHLDSIFAAADGIMIARGDLGVEMPIENIAVVQKQLMHRANILGKPVITATQMLESMTNNRRPTRAEATDVANAILDGTDCVMLSGESAMGQYPVESVAMLAKIAEAIEPHRPEYYLREIIKDIDQGNKTNLPDLIAFSVETTLEKVSPAAIFVPTRSGATARSIARFRVGVWIVALSSEEKTCQGLQFTYGVYPMYEPDHPEHWTPYIRAWVKKQELEGNLVILTEGPSRRHPEANNRMEIIDLGIRPKSFALEYE